MCSKNRVLDRSHQGGASACLIFLEALKEDCKFWENCSLDSRIPQRKKTLVHRVRSTDGRIPIYATLTANTNNNMLLSDHCCRGCSSQTQTVSHATEHAVQ